MNTFQRIRRWQHRSALRTCAVFIALWVNLAFQMCAMATLPAEDCPHCPPGMHETDMSMAPMAPMDCTAVDSIDEPNFVAPTNKFDNDTAELDVAILGGWLDPPGQSVSAPRLSSNRPVPSVHGPPFNLLFGVYLI